MIRVLRRYPKALQLVENVNDEAAFSDSAAGKGGLSIPHLARALLPESRTQDALLSLWFSQVIQKTAQKRKAELRLLSLVPPTSVLPRFRKV